MISNRTNRQRYIGFVVEDKNHRIRKSEIITEIQKECTQLFNRQYQEMGIRIIRFNGKAGIFETILLKFLRKNGRIIHESDERIKLEKDTS